MALADLDPGLQAMVRAAALNLESVDLDSPDVALAAFETVCPDCTLVCNRHLPCTNCSGRG